ncbi:hypothetical protein GCM10011494_27840 [Novosphingobium endophyticum]|uniref:Calcium-binding protein n=1 Tax=Novosphingobium endophyticum TaxID=1955250 RepID=A0A916X6P0_9SPHN|nr:calcium-binding protein [Novosphingobium endophyticum]GGC07649.1 hypothetical protein GCM10011494_27840 [Novosphingobium endophyticum]
MKRLACTILPLLALVACGYSLAEGESREPATDIEAAIPEADFLDTFGVNAHLNYTDGAYARLDRVEAHMRYLGLVHLRTHAGGEAVPLQSYARLAGAGLRFDLIATSDRIDETVDFAARLVSQVPGSVAAIEGFNEINNWPVTYGGLEGEDAARAAQRALYAKVQARPELEQIPVFYFTGGAATDDLSGMADVANVHAYSDNALQPRTFIQSALRMYGGAAARLPRANTEFGNFTLPEGWPERKPYWASATQLGVDETTQAKIVLNAFFEGAALGISRSYVYELLDQKSDPDRSQPEFHFGLFTFDHRPKVAAEALHNLTKYLERTRSAASTGTVGAMLENADDGIGRIVIRRENGSLLVALWNRSEFWRWDQYTSESLATASKPVTVRARTTRRRVTVTVFDPLENTVRPLKISGGRRVKLDVPDYPLLVHFRTR